MKKLILFLFLVTAPLMMYGQNKLKYTYDASGNRTQREIVLSTTRSAEVSNSVFTDELAQRVVKIYPNPTQGQLVVEIPDADKAKSASLTVFNLQGQTVAKVTVLSNMTDVNISTEPNGVYILHINIDGQVSSWRIIKK